MHAAVLAAQKLGPSVCFTPSAMARCPGLRAIAMRIVALPQSSQTSGSKPGDRHPPGRRVERTACKPPAHETQMFAAAMRYFIEIRVARRRASAPSTPSGAWQGWRIARGRHALAVRSNWILMMGGDSNA